jgi:hypothetical protein
MVESPVGHLCAVLIALKELQEQWAIFDSSKRLSELPEYEKKRFSLALEQLRDTTADLSLDACNDRIQRLESRLRLDPTASTIRTDIRTLLEVAEDQLLRRHFLFIPEEKMKYYVEPERLFGLAWERFEDAQSDMRESSRCYALEQFSACVFHCMGVLQQGLYALARHKTVEFKFPIELANWNDVIVKLEEKIGDELKELGKAPRSEERECRLTLLGQIAMQFRYFKDAWRNHVAHGRDRYDPHQAETILKHTIDFMVYLADEGLRGETSE